MDSLMKGRVLSFHCAVLGNLISGKVKKKEMKVDF